MYAQVFIAGFVILLTAFSGKLLMWGTLGKILQKNIKFLVTFAIGIFSVTLYLMFNEAQELQATLGSSALAVALGALTLELLQRVIPEGHHHHGANEDECCEHEHARHGHKINPVRILLGDAVHNIGDGIMLVPAFMLSTSVGVSVTIGVLIHEMVQEISEFFILKSAGWSTKKALLGNLLAQSTIFIGITVSVLIASSTQYVHLLIAFSAGGILYIILRDLLPHTLERIKHEGRAMQHIALLLSGILTMLLVANLLSH